MGRLLGLELNNFKSYKGIVKIGFGDSHFTSIVGPNGSGKSNMMDAISFVLGVRSNQLRSNALVDLIYRDKIQDESSCGQEANPKSAYVKAFYMKDGEQDPTEFTRSINEAGDSTYKIDNKTVNYKLYIKELESENILVKAKNFLVFQGDVEQIASQSGQELTKLFEQVSGSIQYKKEYEILKEEYSNACIAYGNTHKMKRKMYTDLKSFKEGVKKDEQFKKQIDKKNNLERLFIIWKLYHLEKERESLATQLNSATLESEQYKNKLESEKEVLEKFKSLYAKDELSIIKLKEIASKKEQEKETLLTSILPIHSSKQSVLKRMSNTGKRIESLQRDITRQKGYINQFEHQLQVVSETTKRFEQEIKESGSDSFKLSGDDLILYDNLKEKYLSNGGSSLEEKVAIQQNNKQELLEEIELYEKRINISKNRINEELKVESDNLELQVKDLTRSLNEKNAEHSAKAKEWKLLQSNIESTNNKQVELNFKLRDVLLNLEDLSANQRETMKQRKLRENVSTLKRLFPGVKGLVHDLCRPKKDKHSLAISTILGRHFDSIIVDSSQTAQNCISYLKKQRAGSASFIPLDSVDAIIPTIQISDFKDCILAINAIEYGNDIERALQYICADSIICDTLDIAKDLKWNYGVRSKLVTLEGGLIHKAGLMTGGTSKNINSSWDKEIYQNLMLLKDKLSGEIDNLSIILRTDNEKAGDLNTEVSLLSGEVSNLRIQLNQCNRGMKENKTEIAYHEQLISADYEPKIQQLKSKVEEIDKIILNVEEDKDFLQMSVYKELTDKLGFSIKEYEQHTGDLLRQQSKELQQLRKQMMDIQNKLEFERERLESTVMRVEKSEKDLQKVKRELNSLEDDESAILNTISKIEVVIFQEKEKLEVMKDELKHKTQNIKTLDSGIEEISSNIDTNERNIDSIKEDIEKLNIERVGILKNCRISNVELPLLDSSLNELPIDKVDKEVMNTSNLIEIDFSELPIKYKNNNSHAMAQEFEESIHDIENMLKDLQPNSKALQRFDEAQEQYENFSVESDKLRDTEKKYRERFLKVKQKRKELFEECFFYVQSNIDNVYRELTKHPHSTAELAGGSASLTLEDEDEPYLGGIRYHATPPMKRFKDMEYLSGGEKTMAALALLFAINSYQPSPFFVLDEVDAALDTTNIERIAHYIKRTANNKFQFIVISLKNTMFEKSEGLVGVYRQQQENSSKILTLNLSQYTE